MYSVILRPIGIVKNDKENLESTLEISEEFTEALDDIEEFSHIVVLFWLHKTSEGDRALTHILPHGLDSSVGMKGVFSTRMPHRPNPIGLSIVKLINRNLGSLIVERFDAHDGSPILDIKPYTGHPRDLVYDFKAPDWAK